MRKSSNDNDSKPKPVPQDDLLSNDEIAKLKQEDKSMTDRINKYLDDKEKQKGKNRQGK